jgi:hypothetical protein
MQNFIFGQSDKLWRAVVNNTTEFINDHGDTAKVGESVFHQVPWHEVAKRQPKGGHDRPPFDRDLHRTPVFPLPGP